MTIEEWADAFAAACARNEGNPDGVRFTGVVDRDGVGEGASASLRVDGVFTDRHRVVRLMNWQPDFYRRNPPHYIAGVLDAEVRGAVAWVRKAPA